MSASQDSETAVIAILAGGRGTRLRGGKPQARLHGRPLLSHALSAAQETGLQTIVVAKRDSPLPLISCEVLHEPPTPSHPLCGIVTALRWAEKPVLALGCDMPFLSSRLIDRLARLRGPAIVTLRGEPQPLLARWTPAQLPALQDALHAALPLRATISGLPAQIAPKELDQDALASFGDLESLCFNVNDSDDLSRAEDMLHRNAVSGSL